MPTKQICVKLKTKKHLSLFSACTIKLSFSFQVHVYRSDLTEFYKQVPKHLLPSDLGGDGETIAAQHGKHVHCRQTILLK